MSKNFYIADMHFGHNNILAFDNRPFKDVEEMNEALINNWNSVVSDEDIVYVLGDMFWVKALEAIPIMERLKGHKVLIKGNHDRIHDNKFVHAFDKVVDYLEVKDEGRDVVLSHYPIPCYKNHFYGWYHLYGHVHTSFEYNMMEHDKFLIEELYGKRCAMYNVGAMIPYMNYTPRTLDEILKANGENTENV